VSGFSDLALVVLEVDTCS